MWPQIPRDLKQKESFLFSCINKRRRIKNTEIQDGVFFFQTNKNKSDGLSSWLEVVAAAILTIPAYSKSDRAFLM